MTPFASSGVLPSKTSPPLWQKLLSTSRCNLSHPLWLQADTRGWQVVTHQQRISFFLCVQSLLCAPRLLGPILHSSHSCIPSSSPCHHLARQLKCRKTPVLPCRLRPQSPHH